MKIVPTVHIESRLPVLPSNVIQPLYGWRPVCNLDSCYGSLLNNNICLSPRFRDMDSNKFDFKHENQFTNLSRLTTL